MRGEQGLTLGIFIGAVAALGIASVCYRPDKGEAPATATAAIEKPAVVPELALGVTVTVLATKEQGVLVDWHGAGNSLTWDVRLRVTGGNEYKRVTYEVVPFLPSELEALPVTK